jgi:hypothetical protein
VALRIAVFAVALRMSVSNLSPAACPPARRSPLRHSMGYLSRAHLQHLKEYKYAQSLLSPLDVYVMNPFWNACVHLVPMSIA